MKSNSFLAELHTPSVPKSVIAEAINVVLAYSIAAVFLTKNQSVAIGTDHFLQLINNYLARGKTSVDFTSEETASDTFDLISLRTPMSDETRNFIMNNLADPESESFSMVESVIQFLNNNPDFNTIVAQVTNNGILNRIVIDIENISADEPNMTTVLIDNQYVRLFQNVMPVIGLTEQKGGIGQKSMTKDYGYESHRDFLNSTLGVDIGSDSAVYYQTSHNNGSPTVETVEGATRQLYEELCRKINEGLNGAYDSPLNDFKHNIITKMLGSCYGVNTNQDCTCVVMPNNKVQYQSFDVQGLYEKLYNAKLSANCPKNTNPSIRIIDENNKELFQVRFKKERYGEESHRYKMFFKPSKLNEYFEEP